MLARIWRGVTPAEKAEQYLAYLRETGLKDYRTVPGNRGVQVLRCMYESKTEFLLISFWESDEASGAFAGNDLERAVYYPRDKEFLLELEPHVTHYEVATTLKRRGVPRHEVSLWDIPSRQKSHKLTCIRPSSSIAYRSCFSFQTEYPRRGRVLHRQYRQ